jgi:hypothetical protein
VPRAEQPVTMLIEEILATMRMNGRNGSKFRSHKDQEKDPGR